uniref:Uncharacterized protein n=1 Tax=Phlebotomus papatasi TaxID=29031 RepID=A0A1B0D2R4_PHLPP
MKVWLLLVVVQIIQISQIHGKSLSIPDKINKTNEIIGFNSLIRLIDSLLPSSIIYKKNTEYSLEVDSDETTEAATSKTDMSTTGDNQTETTTETSTNETGLESTTDTEMETTITTETDPNETTTNETESESTTDN